MHPPHSSKFQYLYGGFWHVLMSFDIKHGGFTRHKQQGKSHGYGDY